MGGLGGDEGVGCRQDRMVGVGWGQWGLEGVVGMGWWDGDVLVGMPGSVEGMVGMGWGWQGWGPVVWGP